MANLSLFCEDCKDNTAHQVLPWQTKSGQYGAVSTICDKCDKMMIVEISKGYEFTWTEETHLNQ